MKHIINSIVILVLLLPVRLGACAHRADTSGHVAPLAEEAALGIPDTDSSLLIATVWPTPARQPVSKKVIRESAYTRPYSLWGHTPDYRRLALSSGIILGTTVVAAGLLYLMPEDFTYWDKDQMSFSTLGKQWWNNVKAGPVIDRDDLFLNWIAHPYFGGIYYITARGAGFNAPYSFLYSFVASTCFWEYGVEAFAEVPSLQDIIITPVLGAVVGEGFYFAKRLIVANDYRILNSKILGCTVAFLMDPLNELADYMTGGHYAQQEAFSMRLAPDSFSLQYTF